MQIYDTTFCDAPPPRNNHHHQDIAFVGSGHPESLNLQLPLASWEGLSIPKLYLHTIHREGSWRDQACSLLSAMAFGSLKIS